MLAWRVDCSEKGSNPKNVARAIPKIAMAKSASRRVKPRPVRWSEQNNMGHKPRRVPTCVCSHVPVSAVTFLADQGVLVPGRRHYHMDFALPIGRIGRPQLVGPGKAR